MNKIGALPLDYFANKTVAIVGNAISIYDKNYGSIIDDHDEIIRMNHSPMDHPSSEGKKTTIIAFTGGGRETLNFDELSKKFKNKDLKILALNNSGLIKLKRQNKILDNCFFVGEKIKEECGQQTQAKVSAGYLTIHYISKCSPPKSVSIFGYDWKKSRSNWHPEVIKINLAGDIISKHSHKWLKEEEICKSIIKNNNWNLHSFEVS
tara:strand:+ start:98 stop:718 length:621 start_codon:yes stop_codon:yes gene_type:complete